MQIIVNLKGDMGEQFFLTLPDKLRSVVNLALHKSALIIQNTAKELSPYKTGNLRRSITNLIKGGSAYVGSDVVYARVREYNTKKIPDGYLRPALDRNEGRIEKIFEGAIEDLINKL